MRRGAVVVVGMDPAGFELEVFQPVCPGCGWAGPVTFNLATAKVNAAVHTADRHGEVAAS